VNISAPFIDRPVATTLLTIGFALAGAAAYGLLPVAPLPQVDFPTVSVSAQLPGASPEVMAATVATPLERALGRIAGVSEMTSSSSLGSTRITLQFELDREIDGAARDVQAAIAAARSELPTSLPNNPTYRKVNPADAPILILALTSDVLTQGRMYDLASTILAQKLSQVDGIGQISVGGSSLPAVRVELNPTALDQYGIGIDNVRTAIAASNSNRPKGSVEDGARRWQIAANDQSQTAADYLPLVIAWRNGAQVRLRDVADVTDSVQDVRNAGLANGKPSVTLVLFRQPGANILATVDRVSELLPQLRASVPSSVAVDVVMERTSTIRASLVEVERTLAISIGLVILVVFLFLRSARATCIPSVAVPVSLVGTFGVMYLCGYSLDNLSLMALTTATGFVVDDAIVVLENVKRHVERGMTPMDAARLGAREVGFTVLSMSVSLVAVFIPILLMSGIVGRLFREFAVTLSVAIGISLLVSLTTTPMMCARVLRAEAPAPGRLHRASEAAFEALRGAYERTLGTALRHPALVTMLLLATIALNVWLYTVVPKGFFPQQDTGRLTGSIQADQAISFQAMREKFAEFVRIVGSDPAVDSVVGSVGGGSFGGGQRNSGSVFVQLVPLRQRGMSVDQVMARLRPRLAEVPGASLFLQAVQDIRLGGRQSNAQYQYTLTADQLEDLQTWTPRLQRELANVPALVDVNSDQQVRGLETVLDIDRATAARQGIDMRTIDSTLYGSFGQAQVSTIYTPLNQYHVVMEVAPRYWQSPAALQQVYVTPPGGGRVPLASFARVRSGLTPLAINHQGVSVASTLSFNLAPGVSLSSAVEQIQAAAARIGMPANVHGSFQGTARAFQSSLDSQLWLVIAALVAVYIVLGMLYESLVHPITILSTLPSAGTGALLALLLCREELSVMAMIGVILLIGIVKKNAIMMIDFALDAQRTRGASSLDAIREACSLRFRPILMTTLAAMLGAVPLAIGAGDGAELRRPLGIAIVGGLLVSQLLTLYTTPILYLQLDRLRAWASSRRGSLARANAAAEVRP
jgi:multidrug efflux pump